VRQVAFSAAVSTSKPKATLRVSAATVTAGGTMTVTVENGRGAKKDRVMFYRNEGTRTAPRFVLADSALVRTGTGLHEGTGLRTLVDLPELIQLVVARAEQAKNAQRSSSDV